MKMQTSVRVDDKFYNEAKEATIPKITIAKINSKRENAFFINNPF